MSALLHVFDGSYEARRAAALSGVPLSTVYDWARKGVVVPSVSQVRQKLWSYADLMALRIVHWLRHPKENDTGEVAASPMAEVRRALQQLDAEGLDIWSPTGQVGPESPLVVDRGGRIYVRGLDGIQDSAGQLVLDEDVLDLLGVFQADGGRGPDLVRPRPHLRIVPGKLSGEPHVERTRIATSSIAALHQRGFSDELIGELYPDVDITAITEAIALEGQLAGNLPVAA